MVWGSHEEACTRDGVTAAGTGHTDHLDTEGAGQPPVVGREHLRPWDVRGGGR